MQNRELVGREKGSRLALKGVGRLEEGMKKAGARSGPRLRGSSGGSTAWPYLSVGADLLDTAKPPPIRAVAAGSLTRLRTTHLVYGCLSGRPGDSRQPRRMCQRPNSSCQGAAERGLPDGPATGPEPALQAAAGSRPYPRVRHCLAQRDKGALPGGIDA